MATLACNIDGERYSCVLSLMSSSSFRSAVVHVNGGCDVQLAVDTDTGSHQSVVRLVVEPDLQTDIVLGFDWFLQFVAESHCWPERYSALRHLVEVYDMLSRSDSRCFLASAADDIIVRLLFGHGLVVGTSCSDFGGFRYKIMEHMLAGLCASERGPACRDVVSACMTSSVYPHVFVLSCIVGSNVLANVASTHISLYADFLVPSATRNRCRATESAAVARLSAVRYAPYMDEPSYLLRIVNARFERMLEDELKAIARAHCIVTSSSTTSTVLRKLIADHLFLGQCSFRIGEAVPSIPVGCLDFLAEFYFPSTPA